jgi:hypothetical protein
MLNVGRKQHATEEVPVEVASQKIGKIATGQTGDAGEAKQLVTGQGRRTSRRNKVGRMIHSAVRRAKTVAAGVLVAGLLAGTWLATPANAQVIPRNTPTVQTQQVGVQQNVAEARQAVTELRQLHEKGKLARLFERDPNTGAYLNAKDHDILRRLPVIGPNTSVDDLIAYGLIDAAPKGLAELERMPRYFAGKQVFVETSTTNDKSSWGYFDANGTRRITHRGVIAGVNGDNFIIEVAKKGGGKERFEVAKTEVFRLNQPSSPNGLKDNVNGIEIDYNDPIARGKIAQGFFLIAKDLAKLDFTRPADDRTNRDARLAIVHKLFWNQNSEYVRDHHKPWQGEGNMVNILNGGVGVCTVQGTTQWAYGQAFENIAGFRLLNVSGSTIDLDRGHNFNILWLTGSEEMFVTDRTWTNGNEHVEIEDAMGSQGYNRNRYMVGPNDRAPGEVDVAPHHIRVK